MENCIQQKTKISEHAIKDCIFCKIIEGEIPCHKIWEDEKHIAILSIFPNTEAFTVIVTKEHYSSDILEVSDEVATGIFLAARKVCSLLNKKLEDVGRTGIIFEGMGVNHLHLKLFPMHGTEDVAEWKPVKSEHFNRYFEKYEGFIASNDSKPADQEKLAELARKIKG